MAIPGSRMPVGSKDADTEQRSHLGVSGSTSQDLASHHSSSLFLDSPEDLEGKEPARDSSPGSHESHPRFSSEIPTLECANGIFYFSLLWGSKGRGGALFQGFLHSQRGWRVGIFKVKPGASAIPGNISFF